MINFDHILDIVGHFGTYQLRIAILLSWSFIPAGLHNLASVFYAPPVKFRCSVPPIDNSTVYPDLSEEMILNYTSPYDDKLRKYDGCQRYNQNLDDCFYNLSCINKSAPSIKCDEGYYYDKSVFTSSVQSEWDLVCDDSVYIALATSIYFAGMWAGAALSGFLADRIGRRPTLLITAIGTTLSGIGVSVSPWYWLFCIFRFGCAAFSHGSLLISCVLIIEITGKKRTMAGIGIHHPFGIGILLNSLISYFTREWRMFYLVISLFSMPHCIFHLYIPESPRWHFSNGRIKEGKFWCKKFARINGKEINGSEWEDVEPSKEDGNIYKERKYSSFDLFKTKHLRRITFKVMVPWFVVSIVYYGLTLNAGSLSGDIFLNNSLYGVFDVTAIASVMVLLNRCGRRLLTSASFIFGGVALATISVIQLTGTSNTVTSVFITTLAMIGKYGSTMAFAILFNYTGELFPTVIRSNALGVGSMASRIGSIFCPFILELNKFGVWLPNVTFAILSIVAGIDLLFIPETKKQKMAQTIEEAEKMYDKKLKK